LSIGIYEYLGMIEEGLKRAKKESKKSEGNFAEMKNKYKKR